MAKFELFRLLWSQNYPGEQDQFLSIILPSIKPTLAAVGCKKQESQQIDPKGLNFLISKPPMESNLTWYKIGHRVNDQQLSTDMPTKTSFRGGRRQKNGLRHITLGDSLDRETDFSTQFSVQVIQKHHMTKIFI